jgi:hypothetical protein
MSDGILKQNKFWRDKYIQDYGKVDEDVADWAYYYKEKYYTSLPKYVQLLNSTYRELNMQDRIPNNELAIGILSMDIFWQDKYQRDFGLYKGEVNDWRREYEREFYNRATDRVVEKIFNYLIDDITFIRSQIFEKYNRHLPREFRMPKFCSGKDTIIEDENTLPQVWLLDEDDKERKRMEKIALKE